jgi:hypothetical protein
MADKRLETVETVAPDDSLDIASMTREQRDALKQELLRQHLELVERITGYAPSNRAGRTLATPSRLAGPNSPVVRQPLELVEQWMGSRAVERQWSD